MNIVARAEYIKSPKDDAEKLAAYLQFFQTHIVGSKTKSKHFQKCAKSSKRAPYFFFAKAHVFTITTLVSD